MFFWSQYQASLLSNVNPECSRCWLQAPQTPVGYRIQVWKWREIICSWIKGKVAWQQPCVFHDGSGRRENLGMLVRGPERLPDPWGQGAVLHPVGQGWVTLYFLREKGPNSGTSPLLFWTHFLIISPETTSSSGLPVGWHNKRDTIPSLQRMAEIGSCRVMHHSAQPGNILQNCVMPNFHVEKLLMDELQIPLEVPEGFE